MISQLTHRAKSSRTGVRIKFTLRERFWRPALGTQARGSWTRRTGSAERGDTIVEVLIAMAVISLVLGGAYVTTNRSLLATRAAEERGNALKLAESQLEQLKNIGKTDPDSVFGSGIPNPFCISQELDIVGAANEACRVNSSGAPTEVEPIYNLSVTRSGPDSNDGYMFTATTEWVDPSGDMTDQVRIIYRIYDR